MKMFMLLLVVALIFSSIGFKKYVWFISIGYGFSISAIGGGLLIFFRKELTAGTILACVILIIYGCRLGFYLAFRERKSNSYNEKMKTEIKSGNDMKFIAKLGIWISAALLYICETAPLLFRLENKSGTNVLLIIGIVISICGLVIESVADYQKNAAKKKNPKRFVDTGLYKIVRCPNYFGEMLFWTGMFIGGVNIYSSVCQWAVALLGYVGIIYVMFGGARRLEMRQNRTYGNDSKYQNYVKRTPIMIPFVPLYSVEKYKWLVA